MPVSSKKRLVVQNAHNVSKYLKVELTSVVGTRHSATAHLENRDGVLVFLYGGLSWVEYQRSHREQCLAQRRLAEC